MSQIVYLNWLNFLQGEMLWILNFAVSELDCLKVDI